jgi:hypothetical protein
VHVASSLRDRSLLTLPMTPNADLRTG